jgi:hypothetical protein
VQVVVVRIAALEEGTDVVSEFQLCKIAVHFMASRVVVPFIDCSQDEQERAHASVADFMHLTWPIQSTLEGIRQVCSTCV